MKFLSKNEHSIILTENLSYDIQSQRLRIKQLLKDEQLGFCAYSERYIKNTDALDIEHFDGRIKNTPKDSYFNWYAVLSWLNSHKPKKLDDRFLPILAPSSKDLSQRIWYEAGIFICKQDDVEAYNLIQYLGFNNPKLVTDRENHLKRIHFLKDQLAGDFETYLANHKEELSFISALEKEFELDLMKLLLL